MLIKLLYSESLLQIINQALSELAKRKLDAVIAEACEAQFKLEFSPSTTAELANFLTFLDEIEKRVRCTFHSDSSFLTNHKCL